MKFWRRLRFFGFGFGLGLMVVFAMFGTRSCVTPNEQKMQELVFQELRLSEKAQCKLKCLYASDNYAKLKLSKEQHDEFIKRAGLLLKIELRNFEVNYDLSAIHTKPCGEYYIQPKEKFAADYKFNLVIHDCDTISEIRDINFANTVTCSCQ